MGKMRNAYRILVQKPEGKRPLRKPMCRWEDNIRIDILEIGCKKCRLDSSDSGYICQF
jgi:hypothetical protein